MHKNHMNILIIDDNSGDVRLVSEMLKESSAQIIKIPSAGSIAEGLKLLKEVKFNAILLDLNLPDSHGFEGLNKLTALYPDLPIIMLTSQEDESTGTLALKNNAADYLSKNHLNADLLLRSIRYSIERKKKEEDFRRLNRTLLALSHSSQAIVKAKDEDSYLKEVCKIIVEDCGHTMTWIGFAEEDEAKTVRPVAFAGFEDGYLEKAGITWSDTEHGRGPTGTAIRTGEIIKCANMDQNPNFKPWRDEALKRGYSSSIVFPLKAGKKVFGAVSIYSKNEDDFSENEINLLSELASVLSYGIMVLRDKEAKNKAEKFLQWSGRYQTLLSESASKLLEAVEPQKLIQEICRNAMELLDCQFFFNFLFDEGKNRLKLNSYYGIAKEEAKKIEWLDFGVAVCGCVARDRKRIIVQDIPTTKDPRTKLVESYGVLAYCCHPLLVEDKLIGTISFGTSARKAFRQDEIFVMKAVSDLVAVAMRRKQAEDVLKRDKETIENLVKERTLALLNARFELEKARRLSDIGTLATTVAHELRNPLAAINMAAYNIKRKAQDPALESHLATIQKKVIDSNQIINNLLFYSRIKQPQYEKVNLINVLNECIESAYARHTNKSVRVNKEYGPLKEAVIKADEFQMKELFGNILNNAFDAVLNNKGEVGLSLKVEDNSVFVVIKDNGVGIAKDALDKVFDPFFSTKARGTGIGLSISKQIVELHHGEIKINSKEGEGTSVCITLPN
ncbi:MAG: GAF domain-containing protein [Elusimicrobia bacterium]|nr:GAF domain-containing protein [Candidatus Liberimonas magnetica]